jgi:hypothetical protein
LLTRAALSISLVFAVNCEIRAQEREPVITLRRTACLGTCPVYSLEIFEDGFIRYIGTEVVQVQGERRAAIPRDTVEGLVALMLRANYFALHDRYLNCKLPDGNVLMISDLPTTSTSLRVKLRKKSVEDYVCAPKRLTDIEEEIDRVVNTQRWIGSPLLNVPAPNL